MKTILHYGLVLFLIAGVAGLGLSFVNSLTKAPIEKARLQKLVDGQKLAFPGAASFSEAKTAEVQGKTITYYEVFDEGGSLLGHELEYQVGGYQSQIRVLTGLALDGKITAIQVLEQAETPGLGAEVDALPTDRTLWSALGGLFCKAEPAAEAAETPRPWFQAQFSGKTLPDLEVVKTRDGQHITALSGATITSTAVTKAVREPIQLFQEHLQNKEAQK